MDLTTVNIRELVQNIRHYGLPRKIRTDNEFFTVKLIRLSLKLLSTKHQTTDVACPWQNSSIERCFRSFKEKWRLANLQAELKFV